MRKDGVLEALKSSRLSIRDSYKPSSYESKGSHAEAVTLTHVTNLDGGTSTVTAAPRVVSEVRATIGTRGVPKSGRIWKRLRSQRFSRIRNDKPDSTSWQDKVDKKSDRVALKSFAQELKEEKLERQKGERERAVANKKRKLENEKKNEVVVPIKNLAKIKRMRKKQLRSVEKR